MMDLAFSLDLSDAFENEPPPLDFVLPGLVAGTVGALVSPGATGKSFWALEAAAAVAGATDLMNLGIKHTGRALVVAAEDPVHVLKQRMHSFGKHLSASDREALCERLDILPAMAAGIDLRGESSVWTNKLCKRAEGCRLVVIDTLSRVHTGEENDRKDAAWVMRRLETIANETGAAVLFLHHVTKSVALGGQGDQQQAARGSSVWIDEARWAGFLKTMDEKEASEWSVDPEFRRNFVRFGINKSNYCAPVDDVWLKRREGGIFTPAELCKAIPSSKRKSPQTKEVNDENDW